MGNRFCPVLHSLRRSSANVFDQHKHKANNATCQFAANCIEKSSEFNSDRVGAKKIQSEAEFAIDIIDAPKYLPRDSLNNPSFSGGLS